ncbi:family 43 glycosylhydrolase [Microbispora sp. CA-102843]|uniref:family 43 glycosylhydrolase n=1 Tax=Microbispora sp. CA-102843 TaxID=3239952 RepID=UPI003D8F717A
MKLRTSAAARVAAAAATSLTVLAPQPSSAASAQAQPIAWYPMDETTGTTLHNAVSGSSFGAATLVNGATPKGGEGVALDGTDGYVRLPDNLLAGLDSVTVSVDVWIDSGQATPYFIYGLGVSSTGGYLFTTGDTYRSAITKTTYSAEQNTNKGSALARGGWKTLTYTLDDATDTATLYEDGRQVARNTAVTIKPSEIGNGVTTANYVGRSLYSADKYLKGKVRDFRLYNRALTSDELVGDQLRAAVRQFTLGDTSGVTTDLVLPDTAGDGIAVTWQSSAPGVVDATGRVTLTDQPGTAVLTATLAKADLTATKTFIVTTLSRSAAADALADGYVIPPVVASGFTAPSAPAGLTLDLSSDDPAVTATGGVLTASGDEPVDAHITAKVTDGDEVVARKMFAVRVLPASKARYVMSYTRTPTADGNNYNGNLAYSMHLALGTTPASFQALNENYGVLFAKAVPTTTLDVNQIRTLRDPYVFHQPDGTFGVVATRSLSSGAGDGSAASSMLYFTSADLRTYTEKGLVDLGTTGGVNRPQVTWDSAAGHYLVRWADDGGNLRYVTMSKLDDSGSRSEGRAATGVLQAPGVTTSITGAVPSNVIPVDLDVADKLQVRFGRITNTAVEVQDQTVPAGQEPALDKVKAQLTYSDGSTAQRAVTWNADDLAAVDTGKPGTYTVRGTVKQNDYPFPFIEDRADPTIQAYKGKYYFIATDELNGHKLLIRAADTIAGLRTAPDNAFLSTDVANIKGCFWAPELHEFAGTLHVFFSPCIGQDAWTAVQSHVLTLKPGGDPTKAADWDPPQRVLKADGSPLQLDAAHPGISLDMTYFEAAGKSYVAWSQRYITGGVTGDAEIWIATMDPADPYRLTSAPVRIATAEYGWDHNTAAVVEGPFVVEHDGVLSMTYSGSGVGPTYVVGLLTAKVGADLTRADSWSKLNYPVLKTDTTINVWGPGHNSFSYDEDGNLLIVFHAKLGSGGSRDVAVRRVHWAADGMPILDMTKDEEVAPARRDVKVAVTVLPSSATVPLTVVASSRCVGSSAYVAVTAVNGADVPATVTLTTPYGSKTVADVAPGKQAYQSFNARVKQLPAGEVTVTGAATIGGQPVTTSYQAAYPAIGCG